MPIIIVINKISTPKKKSISKNKKAVLVVCCYLGNGAKNLLNTQIDLANEKEVLPVFLFI